jgi:hypothetical protein
MTVFTATAADVQEGDTLPDLDNAYVFEVEKAAASVISWNSGYAGALPMGMRLVSYHDRYGNENYWLVDNEHPVKIERP